MHVYRGYGHLFGSIGVYVGTFGDTCGGLEVDHGAYAALQAQMFRF